MDIVFCAFALPPPVFPVPVVDHPPVVHLALAVELGVHEATDVVGTLHVSLLLLFGFGQLSLGLLDLCCL